MAYIDKNSTVVVSARLTDVGRKLLSTGNLDFSSYRLGDSEIDYSTLGVSYDITLSNVLMAVACQPDMKTPLLSTPTSTSSYNTLNAIQPVILQTITNMPELGFYLSGTSATSLTYTAYTTTDYVLQADSVIPLSGVTTSSRTVPVRQAPTYGTNTYEPKTGDLLMVKMSNDVMTSTQNKGIVEEDLAVPYLWYNVTDVTSGTTLAANDLEIELDRTFAHFPSYAGANECWATFFPSGETQFRSGIYSAGTVWNESNVWSQTMIGVDGGVYETFEDFASQNYVGSKEYFGYTSEITDVCKQKSGVALIHYTNTQTCENQSEQKIGTKFYVDTEDGDGPTLKMPTLMWHLNAGTATTIGQTFVISGDSSEQYLTISGNTVYPTTSGKNVRYFTLSDGNTTPVGRVFPDYQMITVDNQELVSAMSYKSNRNWTLPTLEWDILSTTDIGLIDQTESLYLTYLLASSTGYTTGLHCQNIVCANFNNLGDCPPTEGKNVTVNFPPDQLKYMSVTGETGFYGDTLYVLAQKVAMDSNGNFGLPDPTLWVTIDVTSQIDSHVVGDKISPTNLENTVITLTDALYTAGSTYVLHDFINIPTTLEPNILQFGDETFLYGNIAGKGMTTKYRTKFVLTVPPTGFNTSQNPTWNGSGQNVHISEVGVYTAGSSNGPELVATGKLNLPIEKTSNTTIIIEIAFDL